MFIFSNNHDYPSNWVLFFHDFNIQWSTRNLAQGLRRILFRIVINVNKCLERLSSLEQTMYINNHCLLFFL